MDTILRCAHTLIHQRGYSNVKITEICAEAQVSPSTFYTYFPSKDWLIVEYYRRNVVLNPEDYAVVLSESEAWDQLWKVHSLYCDKMSAIGKEYCFQLNRIESGLSALYDDNRSIVEPLMRRAQAAGAIRNRTSPETLYTISCYLMRGVYHAWSASDSSFDLSREVRSALEVYYNLPKVLRQVTHLCPTDEPLQTQD